MGHRLVITTCPNSETAQALAQALVTERLAACVNIVGGVCSIYEWEGKIVQDAEQILLIKTTTNIYPELEVAIRQRHPYELPEIIAVPIERGLEDYLSWINQQLDKKP